MSSIFNSFLSHCSLFSPQERVSCCLLSYDPRITEVHLFVSKQKARGRQFARISQRTLKTCIRIRLSGHSGLQTSMSIRMPTTAIFNRFFLMFLHHHPKPRNGPSLDVNRWMTEVWYIYVEKFPTITRENEIMASAGNVWNWKLRRTCALPAPHLLICGKLQILPI